MSAEACGYVYRHSPYRGAELLVHLAVADSVNDLHEQRFWMSSATLAVKARCSRTTASAALAQLARDGFLDRLGGGRLDGRPAEYRFLFPDVPVVYDTRKGVPRADTPPAEGVPRADTGCRPSRQEVSREPTLSQENPSEPKTREARKRATSPPDDYQPNDSHRAICAEAGVDLERELTAWLDYCRANGKSYRDHDAALRTWLRRAVTFGAKGRAEPASGPSSTAAPQGPRPVMPSVPSCPLGLCNGDGTVRVAKDVSFTGWADCPHLTEELTQ